MKKKHVVFALIIIGILLTCTSVLLAVIETANADVIGGADFPTFALMWRTHPAYTALALFGIAAAITAAVLLAVKKGK